MAEPPGLVPVSATPPSRIDERARLLPRARAIAASVGLSAAAVCYDPSALGATPKRAAALLAALVLLSLGIARARRCRLPRATVAWLLMAGWALLSLAWSPAGDVTVASLWLGAGAASLGMRQVCGDEEIEHAAGVVALLVGGGAAVAVLWRLVTGGRGAELHGGHGNPDWLGLVLATSLPLQLDVAAKARAAAHRARSVLYALAAASLGAVALTGSRASWLGLGVAALLAGRGRLRLLGVGLAGIGLAGAWVGGDLGLAAAGRWWMWRHCLQAALDAPLLGSGQGGFDAAYLDAQGRALGAMPLDAAAVRFVDPGTAHADGLQLLVEGGASLVLLALLALAVAALDLWPRWRAGVATVVVVAAAGLADVPLRQPAVVLLLVPVMAATEPLPAGRFDRATEAVTLLAAMALLPGAALGWLTERRLSGAAGLPPAARLEALVRAAALDPGSGRAALVLGLAWLELGEPQRALGELERARSKLAGLAVDVALGNAQLEAGRPEAAIAAYRRALARHPAHFRARLDLAEALRRSGRLEAAGRELELARDLQPSHPKLLRLAERLRRDQIDRDTR